MKKISLFGVFGLFCLLLAGLFSPRLVTAFTYQGVLKENGIPVTGTRDMIFSLHGSSNCTGVLQAQNIPDVLVNNGLFNQSVLDIDKKPYDGQRLWLKVTVNSTNVSCQEITPVPLAMSLVPNARIFGDNGTILSVEIGKNTGFTFPTAIVGRSSSDTEGGTGVYGVGEGIYGVGVEASGGYSYGGAALKINRGAIRVKNANIATDTPVFIHKVNTAVGGNLCAIQDYSTVLDNPIINGNPGAILIVTPNYGPKNGGTAPAVGIPAVYYDADNECGKGFGRWVIYNLNAETQKNKSLFNVMAVLP